MTQGKSPAPSEASLRCAKVTSIPRDSAAPTSSSGVGTPCAPEGCGPSHAWSCQASATSCSDPSSVSSGRCDLGSGSRAVASGSVDRVSSIAGVGGSMRLSTGGVTDAGSVGRGTTGSAKAFFNRLSADSRTGTGACGAGTSLSTGGASECWPSLWRSSPERGEAGASLRNSAETGSLEDGDAGVTRNDAMANLENGQMKKAVSTKLSIRT